VTAPLISISEAARLLGRKWDFVARRKVEFRAVRTGRTYGIPPEAIDEFIVRNRVVERERPTSARRPVSRSERLAAVRELARHVRASIGERAP
jgi:hypothetical protein